MTKNYPVNLKKYHSLKEAYMEHKEITEKVIGCAFRVYNQMGYGYLESIYEKCMHIIFESSEGFL